MPPRSNGKRKATGPRIHTSASFCRGGGIKELQYMHTKYAGVGKERTWSVHQKGIMRKRSKHGARTTEGRSSFRRYLFYAALVLLSLALPAILTLRGTRQALVGLERGDGGDSSPASPVVPSKPTTFSEVPPPKAGPVSPSRWQGIAEGIPSSPRSVDDIHLVFSTDCSPYQNYQSILLFHSAEVSEPVTL